jgi:hypothetical protein
MPHTSAIFNSFFFLSFSLTHTHTQPHANNRLLNYNRLKMAVFFLFTFFFVILSSVCLCYPPISVCIVCVGKQ